MAVRDLVGRRVQDIVNAVARIATTASGFIVFDLKIRSITHFALLLSGVRLPGSHFATSRRE